MNTQLLKKYFPLFCLSFFSIFYSIETKASHFAAADIYVKYSGVGFDPCNGKVDYTYTVTLELYGACEGPPFGTTSSTLADNFTIRYSSANAGFNQTITVTQPNDIIVDQLCPYYSSKNNCRVPSTVAVPNDTTGYRKRVYTGTVTLPSAQTDWIFSWTSSARNSAIQNLVNPGGQAIYVEAGLNNVPRHNINTPQFIEEPLPYLCNGVPNTYVNSPRDDDGDSMVTIIRPALGNNAAAILAYIAPQYSFKDPVNSASTGEPFTVNPITGTATFRAPNKGSYVLAFRCDKYQRGSGQYLGHIMRDVQVRVYECNAAPPPMDTLPINIQNATLVGTAGNQMIYACPGSEVKFDINSESSDPGTHLYMRTTNAMAGSTFTATGEGTNKVTGTFSWTPGPSDVGTDPSLTIISIDSTCRPDQPILQKKKLSLIIRVVNGLDAGEDVKFCQLNGDTIQLFARNADNLKVNWTDLSGSTATLINPESTSPKAAPFYTTSYVVTTSDLKGSCKTKDTVQVVIDDANKVELFPKSDPAYVLCRPEYVQLEARFTGGMPLQNLNCGVLNPVECTTPDSLGLYGSPSYGRTTTSDVLGANAPIFPNDVRSAKQQYLVRKKDLLDYGFRSSTLKSLSFEIVNAQQPAYEYSDFSIAIKCTPADTLSKKIGFQGGMTTVYTSPAPIAFPDGWYKFNFDLPYSWDTTQNLIIQLTYKNNATTIDPCTVTTNPNGNSPMLRFVPTNYISALAYKATDNIITDVTGAGNPPEIVTKQARPLFGITFCEAPAAPLTVQWTPTTYLSDASILQPLAYVPKSARYTVETFGRNGCIIRDTFDVYVPIHNFSVTPSDSTICYGETVPLTVLNGFAYKWFEYQNGAYVTPTSLSCIDCVHPIAKPKVTTEYRVMVYDSVWCSDTLTARVEVLPLPPTNILTNDTVIKYGSKIQLQASGAKLYNWMPGATLDNPNISYPIATPTQTTKYVLGGIGNNGCRSYDTLTVAVDNRDDLLVPTAFSPNGDGKNDMFRVANLTFQRLQEFRVFNRWGQEVFTGTDNKGWDGTWKGKPQDVGAYQYVIRVAYPDGFVETYKGDVTLVK